MKTNRFQSIKGRRVSCQFRPYPYTEIISSGVVVSVEEKPDSVLFITDQQEYIQSSDFDLIHGVENDFVYS